MDRTARQSRSGALQVLLLGCLYIMDCRDELISARKSFQNSFVFNNV